MIRDRLIALLFRLVCFCVAVLGLLEHLNFFGDHFNFPWMMYYTIQSNLLVIALFGVLIVKTCRDLADSGRLGSAEYFANLEMICVIDILVTMIVFWVLLAPASAALPQGFSSLLGFGNLAVHLITPLLCLLDYLLFTGSRHLTYRDVYLPTVFPLAYVLYSSTAGVLGYVYQYAADGKPVRFPYFFFDFDRIGIVSVLNIGALLIFFLLLSHGLYFFDRRVTKPVLIPWRDGECLADRSM